MGPAHRSTVAPDPARAVPPLPRPRGPLSERIVSTLGRSPGDDDGAPGIAEREPRSADPFGDDVQLALTVCYELHYRGFAGVDPEWEWHPGLLAARRALERRFLAGLRAEVAGGTDGDAVTAELDALLIEPVHGGGLTHYLRDEADWARMREYLVHRSIYHLKEADPHAWVIPRLHGQAKAALVAVEFDEFGGGRYDRMHSRLYADLMEDAGLDAGYLAYLEHVPAEALAPVNLMSLLGLHRGLRGALVGHFAAAEISTAPSAARMVDALDRLGAGQACRLFFTEHVEADSVHEQVMRHEVIGDLLATEPGLAGDVVFGIQATGLVEARLADHVLGRWRAGRSSLRSPVDGA
ncbi:iron-containing redox enzyme family protein [Saccharomonospora saliphila]|uniref:iron-containing redox enzyme family protein n=1 Tax=Saccharomonospora saliphila TaxID=369829 RepID=UPI0006628F90